MKDLFCDILIKRNSTLPATASQLYQTACDNQASVHVSAYQGESEDPSKNFMLNTFLLSGIPKGRAGKEKMNLTFEYDLNGILKASAQIMSTGKSAAVTVDTAKVGKNLDLSKWTESTLSKQYRQIIKKADRLAKIHGSGEENGVEMVTGDVVIASSDLERATDELKKALVLGWEKEVVESLGKDLQLEIEELEGE
jgi:molecular chaperone DnaK (HSP70)